MSEAVDTTASETTKVRYRITRSKGNAVSTIETSSEELASKWLEIQAMRSEDRSGVVIKVVEIITTERELSYNAVGPNSE